VTVNLDDPWAFITGRVYAYQGWSAEQVEAGDTLRGIDLQAMSNAEHVTRYNDEYPIFVEIPGAYIDGIHDDLMGRSNFERLEEDYGDYLYRASWTYSDHLLVRVGERIPETLMNAILGFNDYPLYDEEDYSRREWEAYESCLDEAIDHARRVYEMDNDELTEDQFEAARVSVQEHVSNAGQWCRDEDVDWDEVAGLFRDAIGVDE
jgi:hypothetical protein